MSFIGKITVETPGLFTTIQDGGRNGYRRYGVPVSGVMDGYSSRLANLLVGNGPWEPLLEITITGPTLVFHDVAAIALTGANISPVLNDKTMPMYQTVMVKTGDKLSFGKLKAGCRAYLSVSGGLVSDYFLDSCSTYVPARFGGHNGQPLKRADWLFYHQKRNKPGVRKVPQPFIPLFVNKRAVRVLRGPEWIGEEQKNIFESTTFTVSKDADRMGIRLMGYLPEQQEAGIMVSSPLAPGVIQMIPSGELIIAMMDGQTTGGYPRVASLISADMGYVAQMKPGDKLNFRVVEQEEANALFLRREGKLKHAFDQRDA